MAVLKGIYPVIPTLFREDNSLDLAAQAKVVHWALESGAHGLVFPGVASEYNFLGTDERAKLVSLVASEAGGSTPIIGGASAPTVPEVVSAGRNCLEDGIRHLMVMAPKGLGQDPEAQLGFFQGISESLADAEIILQNAPQPIGAGLSARDISGIVAACPAITYVKEETLPSGPAITALLSSGIPHLKGVWGGGGARYIIDEFDRGAIAALPAVELVDLHVALYDAHVSGDHDRARHLYRLSLPLLASQAIYRMRLTKYVLAKRGVAEAFHVRAPLPELDDFAKADIDRMVLDLLDGLA